ncbi:cytosolic NADP-malic enzyme-like protein [Lithospermum erythrorhizon]|uniref:Cytosolic NADP-malic enzyme-like protein n=1 Tax=Lithospermum erythrorhizon TaxID=34254 RepID=A0AAV3PQ02_LITER
MKAIAIICTKNNQAAMAYSITNVHSLCFSTRGPELIFKAKESCRKRTDRWPRTEDSFHYRLDENLFGSKDGTDWAIELDSALYSMVSRWRLKKLMSKWKAHSNLQNKKTISNNEASIDDPLAPKTIIYLSPRGKSYMYDPKTIISKRRNCICMIYTQEESS